MPITVTAPEGVLTPAGKREILPRLIAALIEASGLTGNRFFTDIVGGTVQVLPADQIYAGTGNRPLVMVELKLPNIGLPHLEARAAFIKAATAIVADATVPEHRSEDTWINILNAADGAWGVGGMQYSNEALIAGVTGAL